MDKDGDGKIDAEEFAAIAGAKKSMDELLQATTKEEVSSLHDSDIAYAECSTVTVNESGLCRTGWCSPWSVRPRGSGSTES